ncbi:MAG: methyltransferase [Candidatus Cloacimonetes bacterium]|nr:methyltransferase [Candidatus Cloacimonadota bacterium]
MKPNLKLPGTEQRLEQAGHAACSDTALLVEVALSASPKFPCDVLELGCGAGLAALQLQLARPQWRVSGLELQPHLADIARRNAGALGLPLRVHTADLRSWVSSRQFHIIAANPPHIPVSQGRLPLDHARALARHELACTMDDVVAALSRLLSPSGQAWLLYPQSRCDELHGVCRQRRLDIFTVKHQPKGHTAVFGLRQSHANARTA